MKILILTNEYPPNVYGGAGVHVDYLVRELAATAGHDIRVLCFGDQHLRQANLEVQGVDRVMNLPTDGFAHPALVKTLLREIAMTGSADEADIVHCHTWYTHLAGCLVKQLTGAGLVLTTHSLEPHRPWKFEQLGTSYHASSWMEKTAYENADGVIAVSGSMREDVQTLYRVPPGRIRVIHNGIDINEYRKRVDRGTLIRYGIDSSKPFILFVGRITRQKGIFHLLNAVPHIRESVQVVLCAGAADTRGLEEEMSARVEQVRLRSKNPVIWIPQVVPKPDIIHLYSAAAVFVCPSIYEPFGIINLEAMACGTPVVASATGGIPEIVVDGETGVLVPYRRASAEDSEPADPDQFARDLAAAADDLLSLPGKMASMGEKGRQRVEQHFSWRNIALQTINFYREIRQNQPTHS